MRRKLVQGIKWRSRQQTRRGHNSKPLIQKRLRTEVIGLRRTAADGQVEAACQRNLLGGGGLHLNQHARMLLMKIFKARNQPAHGKRCRCADTQQHGGAALAIASGCVVDALKGFTDFQRERQCMRGRRHALPGSLEQLLTQPVF
ncbi:hypothetical protein D9M71_622370 [compost metagenome]